METQRIQIRITSYDKHILNIAVDNITKTLKYIENKEIIVVGLPTKITKYTLLKSPHVDKKARDQWEQRKMSRLIQINNIENLPLYETIIKYITKHIIAGVGIRIMVESCINIPIKL